MQHQYAPGRMTEAEAEKTATVLQCRLTDLVDLSLTLKHAHWNVVGGAFFPVHEALDEFVTATREMSDATAERVAALGGIPNGLPGHLVATRSRDDYAVGRGGSAAHLGALDTVYHSVVSAHRDAIDKLAELDVVSADLLTQQAATLEKQQWMMRAHLQDISGTLPTTGAVDQLDAAASAAVAHGES